MSESEVRALLRRIDELEDGLRNIRGMAQAFDADPDFRSIADIADSLLFEHLVPAGSDE